MKNMTMVSIAVMFLASACGAPEDPGGLTELFSAEGAVGQLFAVEPTMDGHVDNWAGADTGGERIRVGYAPGWFGGRDYRGIMTFDTADVPENAVIHGVWLSLVLHPDSLEDLPASWTDYAHNHVVIDVAGPDGFGGNAYFESFSVTGFDYYTSAATSTAWVQDPVVGAVHLYNPDLNPSDVDAHLNRDGLTQIRLRFATNPDMLRLEFRSGETEPASPDDPYPQPFLYVIWE